MDGLRYPPLDDVGDPDYRIRNVLPREGCMCSRQDGINETLVGDGHLVVLGEHGDDAVILHMGEGDFLGVRLDEWNVTDLLLRSRDCLRYQIRHDDGRDVLRLADYRDEHVVVGCSLD